jgi:hypothetical protein
MSANGYPSAKPNRHGIGPSSGNQIYLPGPIMVAFSPDVDGPDNKM